MTNRRPLFAANWKMNKLLKESESYVRQFQESLGKNGACDVVLAPPATHLTLLSGLIAATSFQLGAQNCGIMKFGAYTGEISPAVIKEAGAQWVILGHSERRHVFKEEDLMILSRAKAAIEEGLNVILCVGEILQDRKVGKTFKVVESQLGVLKHSQFPTQGLKTLVVAYEPVWAIGTGENATPQQAEEVHQFIRGWASEKFSSEWAAGLRILYGGSVKAENAAQLMAQPNVDGFLVGTASLDPVSFAGVIKNGLKSRL